MCVKVTYPLIHRQLEECGSRPRPEDYQLSGSFGIPQTQRLNNESRTISAAELTIRSRPIQRWRQLSTTEVKGLLPDDFISTQAWYESRDGTKVPMFTVRYKDIFLVRTTPTQQYGPFTPAFPPPWMCELTVEPGSMGLRFQHPYQSVLRWGYPKICRIVQRGARRSF